MTEFGEKIYEVLTSMGNADCEAAAVVEAFRARADECNTHCDPDWEEYFTEMAEALEEGACARRDRGNRSGTPWPSQKNGSEDP